MQRRILKLLIEENTTREIAIELNIPQSTLNYQIKKLRESFAKFRP